MFEKTELPQVYVLGLSACERKAANEAEYTPCTMFESTGLGQPNELLQQGLIQAKTV